MIRPLLKVLLLAAFLPGFSWAAGLGELKVISALGQPLKADIDLVSMKDGEAETLEAHIASADAFKQSGVEFNPLLANVKVSIAAHPDGRSYVRLISSEAVNDPFLDVIIELSWSSGQLMREYTLLLDPVEFAKTPGISPPVAVTEKRLEPPKPAEPAPSGVEVGKYGPVRKGETLSGIAMATRPEGVSLEQMLVALYQANAEAFDGKNMNRLEAGRILRVPERNEIVSIGRHEAEKVVKVQTVDWNAYRQQLASSVVARKGGLSRSVSGKITASVEKSPVSPQPQEVLRLSKGEAVSKTAGEEEKAAQIKSMSDASERILVLEKNIKEMKKLLAMKNKALAQASAPLAVPKQLPKPSSAFDGIMENPVLLGVAGGVVLGLAGILILLLRKGGKAPSAPQDQFASSVAQGARRTEPALEKPAAQAAAEMQEADPLEEAQLYFSYRRYAQAEEILKTALLVNPANFAAYILLMKVHAASADRDKLELAARRLQAAEPPHGIWENAMEIGFAADPKNPLYGGAVKAEAEPAAIDLAEPGKESLDFDLDFDMPSGEDVDLHLDEALEEKPVPVDLDILPEEKAASVDFDLSAMVEEAPEISGFVEAAPEIPAVEAEPAAEEAPVDFDLSEFVETTPEISGFVEAKESPVEEAIEMPPVSRAQFDISEIPSLVETGPRAKQPEMVIPDVDLHLGETPLEVSKPRDSSWYEVATKIDLAKVYQEMGDHEGAHEILEEVMNEGDADQRAMAKAMLGSLSRS